ncbi:DNA cytosine methyltransferase [Haloimpatiens lingqiaonensis]|uniref:DNA cytosine methyltransferase n=1 Tax=Haloimpatiens lingqiaonensis TaxID=1380675 RepID=UPI0010FECDC5|nr:DNA cytosine methyltransferase [Haloimpatiens lingqiaonensis]
MGDIKYINPNFKHIYSVVSLFSGAGGLDMGLHNQGFKTIWANDIDVDACETHKAWSGADVVCGDIGKIGFDTVPKSDIIVGGFPCQGFSLAGPRKIDDKRNTLYRYFVKLLGINQPYAFIAENVKGILTLGDGAIIEAIIEDFSERGYDVYPNLVNAADYGVPQDRWRVLMVGFRKDLKVKRFEFPKPFNYKMTLQEALRDLPKPGTHDICNASYSSRFMSRNRKRNWHEVSYTIPAMAKQVPIHPESPDMIKLDTDLWKFGDNGVTRRLSWQECAAIQTFPQGMYFAGNLTSKYKQIGNAVPVKLAEVVASAVHGELDKCIYGEKRSVLEVL